MKLRTITGSLSAWGSYESDRYGTTKYDYLRFTTNDGSDGYFQNALSLPLTDSLLNGGGGSRTYYFAPVALPKMFGNLHCNVLYAVRDQGRIKRRSCCRWLCYLQGEAGSPQAVLLWDAGADHSADWNHYVDLGYPPSFRGPSGGADARGIAAARRLASASHVTP